MKSKRFFGDFRAELTLTISALVSTCETSLGALYSLDSVLSKLNEIKIRIDDREQHIDLIITIILRYNNDDKKYGNVHVEIVFSGVSEKPKSDFLGKYGIVDRVSLQEDILQYIIRYLRRV